MPYPYQPYKPTLKILARNNRHHPTPAETLIWQELLRKRQLEGHKFLRQKPIHGYIVDFYCSALKLVIEIDGASHLGRHEYDKERSKILKAHGLHILRFNNEQVLNDIEGIRLKILAFIHSS